MVSRRYLPNEERNQRTSVAERTTLTPSRPRESYSRSGRAMPYASVRLRLTGEPRRPESERLVKDLRIATEGGKLPIGTRLWVLWSKGWFAGTVVAHDYGKPLVVDTPLVIYKIRYDDGDILMEHLHLGTVAHVKDEDEPWQRLEVRCFLTGEPLTDPALLPGCTHRPRANFEALRKHAKDKPGVLACPVPCCSVRTRGGPSSVTRDETLCRAIEESGVADGRAVAWIRGHEISPEVPLPKEPHSDVGTKADDDLPDVVNKWVQCDVPACGKWRMVSCLDGIGERWYCSMNLDPRYNSCELPEEVWDGEEEVCEECEECEDADGSVANAPEQKTVRADGKPQKRRRCGECSGCLQQDCRECSHCRDNPKYGGPGTQRQACKLRRCLHMEVTASRPDPRSLLDGLGMVQCELCEKWRVLPEDSEALPEHWTCAMPPWGRGCDVPEERLIELARSTRGVDVAYSTTASAGDDGASGSHLGPGTVVWARQPGFKPWPSRCERPQSNVPPPKGTSVLVSYFGFEKHTCVFRPRTLITQPCSRLTGSCARITTQHRLARAGKRACVGLAWK